MQECIKMRYLAAPRPRAINGCYSYCAETAHGICEQGAKFVQRQLSQYEASLLSCTATSRLSTENISIS